MLLAMQVIRLALVAIERGEVPVADVMALVRRWLDRVPGPWGADAAPAPEATFHD